MKSTKKLKRERIFTLVAIGLLAVIFSISTASAASEVYVNETGSDTPGAGTIDNPFKTIEYGINQVDNEGTVNILAGTYTGTGNKGITISKNLTISGAGKDSTIIDAQNAGKVFTINPDYIVIIKNLTIQNAKNDAPIGNNDNLGGAIWNKGTLYVENVKFIGNKGHKGSAIANEGILEVTGSTFSNGVDNEWGGAIMNMGDLTVKDSIFTSNHADTEGGAIVNHNIATITGSTFESNTSGSQTIGAPGKGGAIFSVTMFYSSNLIANNNRFINNRILNAEDGMFGGKTGNQLNDIYLAFHDEYSYTGTADLKNNWWGQSTGPVIGQNIFQYGTKGSYTYSPWLTSDPNGGTPPTDPTDLRVDSVTTSGSTATGIKNYVVSSSVKNYGEATTKTFYVSYYLSTDATKSNDDKYIGHATINGIGAGSAVDAQILASIPKDLAQGNYYVIAVADVTGLVTESNEANNIKASASKIAVWRPDLRVKSVTTSGSAVSGSSYVVSSMVENNGGTISDTFYVSYYLSTDATKSSNDRYIGHATINGLEGWTTTNAQITATIPKDIAQGNYYIIAVADVTSLITENYENNNIKASASKIAVWKPDIRVKSVTTSGNTSKGATNYVVSSLVENNGGKTEDTFYVSYYLSTDATKSSNDKYIGHATVNGLGGWSTTNAQITATIPKDISSGWYYIIAVSDVTGTISESYETNNNRASANRIYIS